MNFRLPLFSVACVAACSLGFPAQGNAGTLQITVTGPGSVTPDQSVTGEIPDGTVIQLTASADAGKFLQAWSGSVPSPLHWSVPDTLPVTVNGATTVTAVFGAVPPVKIHALSGFNPTTQPVIALSGDGSTVLSQGDASTGYAVKTWTEAGGYVTWPLPTGTPRTARGISPDGTTICGGQTGMGFLYSSGDADVTPITCAEGGSGSAFQVAANGAVAGVGTSPEPSEFGPPDSISFARLPDGTVKCWTGGILSESLISGDGQWVFEALPLAFQEAGVRRRNVSTGVATPLNTPFALGWPYLAGVNHEGTVLWGSVRISGFNDPHAFRWAGAGFDYLPLPAGATWSELSSGAAAANGSVLVGYAGDESSANTVRDAATLTVWDAAETPLPFVGWLGANSSYPAAAPFTFSKAFGVSANGSRLLMQASLPGAAESYWYLEMPAAAVVTFTLDGLTQTQDGTAKPVIVTPSAAGTAYTVTYNGDTAPPILRGSYDVVVTATGGPVGEATATLTILPPVQSISFPALADITLGDGSVTLAATATSGLPVSYTLVSGSGTFSGDSFTPAAAGPVVIRAEQSGSDDFQPAAGVEQTLTVLPGIGPDQGLLRVVIDGPGTVTVSGGSMDTLYPAGTSLTLTPSTSGMFIGWSGAGYGRKSPLTVSLNAGTATTVRAIFRAAEDVSIRASGTTASLPGAWQLRSNDFVASNKLIRMMDGSVVAGTAGGSNVGSFRISPYDVASSAPVHLADATGYSTTRIALAEDGQVYDVALSGTPVFRGRATLTTSLPKPAVVTRGLGGSVASLLADGTVAYRDVSIGGHLMSTGTALAPANPGILVECVRRLNAGETASASPLTGKAAGLRADGTVLVWNESTGISQSVALTGVTQLGRTLSAFYALTGSGDLIPFQADGSTGAVAGANIARIGPNAESATAIAALTTAGTSVLVKDPGSPVTGSAGGQAGAVSVIGDTLWELVPPAGALPFGIVTPALHECAGGETVILHAEASGSGMVSLQWLHDGTPIPGATKPWYALSSASGSDTGHYSVALTNASGTWESPAARLVVTQNAQTITFNAPSAAAWDQPLALAATATSGLPVSFQVVSGPGSVVGDTLTFSGPGDVIVSATQAGSAGWLPAAEVTRTISAAYPLSFTPAAGGSITAAPVGSLFSPGAEVTLTATPVPGFTFTGWTGDASGTGTPLVVTMDQSRTIGATFADITAPVAAFAAVDGTVRARQFTLAGSLTDSSETPLTVSLTRNGVALPTPGAGAFSQSVALDRGENVFVLTVSDGVNTTAQTLTITWAPDAFLSVGDETAGEGRIVTVPVILDSIGSVAAASFDVTYDTERLREPDFVFDPALPLALSSVSEPVPGTLRATFTTSGSGLEAGVLEIASLSFRVRSPSAEIMETPLTPSLTDIFADTGDSLQPYSGTAAGTLTIEQRALTGDPNNNRRLDVGDAILLQRFLTGAEALRLQDNALNDLNGTGLLDSGDVLKVLRAVVGLDPQPEIPAGRRGVRDGNPNAERFTLTFDKPHALPGELVTLTVTLTNPEADIPGTSFTLHYPVDALRLENSAAHQPGSLVPVTASRLWNVSPAQNNYTLQDGRIAFAASSSGIWTGSAAGGPVATFAFRVQAGVAAQAGWPLTVTDGGVAGADGYDLRTLPTASAVFAPASDFATWAALALAGRPAADQTPTADPDGDGLSNALEFLLASDPASGSSVAPWSATKVGDSIALSLTTRTLAEGWQAALEHSPDLSTWTELATEAESRDNGDGTTHLSWTVTPGPAPAGAQHFYRVRAVEVP